MKILGREISLGAILIFGGIALVLALACYKIPEDAARDRLRVKLHVDYCASKGWQPYTNYGLKCVDSEGKERAIPDAVWNPLR